jgi:hypothetical protein
VTGAAQDESYRCPKAIGRCRPVRTSGLVESWRRTPGLSRAAIIASLIELSFGRLARFAVWRIFWVFLSKEYRGNHCSSVLSHLSTYYVFSGVFCGSTMGALRCSQASMIL